MLDAHVHVWDAAELRYELFAGHPRLGRSHLLDAYFDVAGPLGVQRAICVEAASAGADGRRESEWLVRHVAGDERVAGIVAWAPLERPELGSHLRALRALGGDLIVGVRRSFEFEPSDFPARREVVGGARLAGEHGFVVDLVMFRRSLGAAIALVRACPETSFVLDHLAKPGIADGEREPWATQLAELAEAPNVSAKLSGLTVEAGPGWSPARLAPYVAHALACFTPERLMVGSDWPIADPPDTWFAAVRELLAPEALDSVLGTTAARVYGV